MSIGKIVVPLTGTQRDREALATAFAAAKSFNAHVDAVFVRPDPRLAMPYTGVPVSPQIIQEIIDDTEKMNREAAKNARAALAESAAAAGVVLTLGTASVGTATCSFHEVEGYFSQCIAKAARLSDLVVFGPVNVTDGPELADGFADILLRTERPVLLAHSTPAIFPGKVFIAWDGSTTAAHALLGAMPFLEKAREIILLSCQASSGRQTDFKEASNYLASHHLSCCDERVALADRSIGEALLDGATKGGADLLVMGGYGHSRLGETIFGGVTQHVRWRAKIPVLMIH